MRPHLAALLLVMPAAAMAQNVSMSGSLGDKALLVIDGTPRTVAAGATVGGVKVVSVSGSQTVVEVGGKRQTLLLGGAQVNLGGTASAGSGTKIVLAAGPGGHFVTTRDEFLTWVKGRKQVRMDQFYPLMRQKLGLLVDAKGRPEGGKWSFDADNREHARGVLAREERERHQDDDDQGGGVEDGRQDALAFARRGGVGHGGIPLQAEIIAARRSGGATGGRMLIAAP